MGIDYVKLNPVNSSPFPWAVGKNDDGWPLGDGGGPNASFVQENGVLNPLPGKAINLEIDQRADNDYYLAGNYTTTIPGNGSYTPLVWFRSTRRRRSGLSVAAPILAQTMSCATTSTFQPRCNQVTRSR